MNIIKKIILLAAIAALTFYSLSADAQEAPYKTALGVRLSSAPAHINNSISLKHFFNNNNAIEALFSFGDPLGLGALYEIHKPFATTGLQWFYGGGGYVGFDKSFNNTTQKNETDILIGGMGVVGLDYRFSGLPINLSIDWKPELNIINKINFEPAAVGVSFRFVF